MVGHGAGYAQYDKLSETFGKDVELLFNIDTVGSQLLDPKTLNVKDAAYLIDEMVKRYRKDVNPKTIPVHVSIGFANTWTFLSDVLPAQSRTTVASAPRRCRRRLWRPTSPMVARYKATASSFIRRDTSWPARTRELTRSSCSL